MKNENIGFEKYEIIIELIKYESERLWQVFHLYLIAHALFLGLYFNLQAKSDYHMVNFIGILGILLCIPWAGGYFRHSQWYIFRMNDAKEIEKIHNWRILRKKRNWNLFDNLFRPMYTTPFVIIGIFLYISFF